MAMLAAIAGISPWERHSNLTDKFLIDDDGGIVMRHTIRTMVCCTLYYNSMLQ